MFGFIKELFGQRRKSDQSVESKYAQGIKDIKLDLRNAEKETLLSDAEINAITNALPALETESISTFAWQSALDRYLKELWNPELKLLREKREAEAAKAKEEDSSFKGGVKYSIAEPEWYIGLTGDFNKAIGKIDKKLQGRILQALGNIVKAPLVSVGNTVKPLTGNKKGLWRYRIGDFRLIYQPDQASKHILLLSVLPRGSAYE